MPIVVTFAGIHCTALHKAFTFGSRRIISPSPNLIKYIFHSEGNMKWCSSRIWYSTQKRDCNITCLYARSLTAITYKPPLKYTFMLARHKNTSCCAIYVADICSLSITLQFSQATAVVLLLYKWCLLLVWFAFQLQWEWECSAICCMYSGDNIGTASLLLFPDILLHIFLFILEQIY